MSQQTHFINVANRRYRPRAVGIATVVTTFLVGGLTIAAGPASAAEDITGDQGCTISGTAGDDWLVGHQDRDEIICGDVGKDLIDGSGGKDTLNVGQDELRDLWDKDLLVGGNANQYLLEEDYDNEA